MTQMKIQAENIMTEEKKHFFETYSVRLDVNTEIILKDKRALC
jgi:hypothetical protein